MQRVLPWVLAVVAAGIVALIWAVLPADDRADAAVGAQSASMPAETPETTARHDLDDVLVDAPIPTGEVRTEAVTAVGRAQASETFIGSGRVSGSVTGESSAAVPLPGATVTLWKSRGRETMKHIALTGADGRFELEGIGIAYWFAEVTAPGHGVDRFVVPVTPEAPAATFSVALPCWRDVQVTILDAHGTLASAEALGLRAGFAHALGVEFGPAVVESSRQLKGWSRPGDKNARSEPLDPERMKWRVQAYAMPGDALHVLLGSKVLVTHVLAGREDQLEIRVDPRVVRSALVDVTLRIDSNEDARPVVGAEVDFTFGRTAIETLTTDAHGIVVLRGVPPAPIQAGVRAAGYISSSASTRDPGPEPLHVSLEPGWVVSGRVEGTATTPTIEDLSAEGFVMPSLSEVGLWRLPAPSEVLGRPVKRLYAQDGLFRFDGVPRGTYALSCGGKDVMELRCSDVLAGVAAGIVVIEVGGYDRPDVVLEAVADATPLNTIVGRKPKGGR